MKKKLKLRPLMAIVLYKDKKGNMVSVNEDLIKFFERAKKQKEQGK